MEKLSYSFLGFFLLLLVAYIFGMMMFHIFDQKVRDKSLDTVVVHLYPKKGKRNTFKIKHSQTSHPATQEPVVEGFHGKCCSMGKIQQKVYKPKKEPKRGILKNHKSNLDLPVTNKELAGFYQDSEPLASKGMCDSTTKKNKGPTASEDTNSYYAQTQPGPIRGKGKDTLVEGFANTYQKCDKFFNRQLKKRVGKPEGYNIEEY